MGAGGGVGAERVRAVPATRRAAANEGGGGDRVAFSNRAPGVARGEWYLQGRERAPGGPCDVGSHAGRTTMDLWTTMDLC